MLRPHAGTVLPVRQEAATPVTLLLHAEKKAEIYQADSLIHCVVFLFVFLSFPPPRFRALVKRRRDGVLHAAASLLVPPIVGNATPTHHCVPEDVEPELVFFCRHVYDFRYGRLLKNLQ